MVLLGLVIPSSMTVTFFIRADAGAWSFSILPLSSLLLSIALPLLSNEIRPRS